MHRWVSLSILALVAACQPQAPAPPAFYTVSELAPAAPFTGVHGLAVAPDGAVLAGSVVGQAIWRIDPATKAVTLLKGPPDGMADDIAFSPDGKTMAWTGYLAGKVFIQTGDAEPVQVADGLPGANSLAFSPDGKLYFTQVFLGDALYEADLTGKLPPRKIAENLGGLNGFEVGKDGKIYGPLWFKGVVARVDPKTGKATTIAKGFKIPAAVNIDSKGALWVVDAKAGELIQINAKTGARGIVVPLAPGLDNLAIAPDDTIYVSNMAQSQVDRISPDRKTIDTLVKGAFAAPADLAFADGKLHIADTFNYKVFDLAGGAATDILRAHRDTESYPIGVDVGAKTVRLTSWAAGALMVVDRASGAKAAEFSGFVGPVDSLELADGAFLVAQADGKLIRVSGADGATRETVGDGLAGPVAMAMAGDGAIYITLAKGEVVRFDLSSRAAAPVATGLNQPEGIAVDPAGRLIVAEVGAKRVVAIDPKTGATTPLAVDLPIGLAGPAGAPPAYLTTGVAAGADGAIYVSSDLKNTVLKLAPPAKP